MKVFISWSGERSKAIAAELYDWLPAVLQYVKPFMSKEAIEKGTRWSPAIAKELEETNFGVFCLTPENVDAPWIHFEAGALAKVVDESRVAPILFDLKPSDVQNPLSQFQLTLFVKDDFKKLLLNMNAQTEARVQDRTLLRLFDVLWPELDSKIKATLPSSPSKPKASPPQTLQVPDQSKIASILEELLTHARRQSKIFEAGPVANDFRVVQEMIASALHEIRTAGIPTDHPMWDALDDHWKHFKLALRHLPLSTPSYPEVFRDAEERLDHIIGVVLDHANRGRSPRSREAMHKWLRTTKDRRNNADGNG